MHDIPSVCTELWKIKVSILRSSLAGNTDLNRSSLTIKRSVKRLDEKGQAGVTLGA